MLHPIFGQHNRPGDSLVRATIDRFCATSTLGNSAHPQRRLTIRTEDAIAIVEQRIEEDLIMAIRLHALQVEPSALWNILEKYLKFRAYKMQLVR